MLINKYKLCVVFYIMPREPPKREHKTLPTAFDANSLFGLVDKTQSNAIKLDLERPETTMRQVLSNLLIKRDYRKIHELIKRSDAHRVLFLDGILHSKGEFIFKAILMYIKKEDPIFFRKLSLYLLDTISSAPGASYEINSEMLSMLVSLTYSSTPEYVKHVYDHYVNTEHKPELFYDRIRGFVQQVRTVVKPEVLDKLFFELLKDKHYDPLVIAPLAAEFGFVH